PPPPPVPPLAVLTRRLPAAIAEREYSVQLAAQGGSPPYRWSLVRGPGWLHADAEASGAAGRPAIAHVGAQAVTWEVADATGRSVRSADMSLQVLPPAGDTPAP